MSIYVSEMMISLISPRWRYSHHCYLVADTTKELHSFARKLSLKRSWFQNKTLPHYDLTINKRRQAVKFGAIEINRKLLVEKIREQRQECTGCEKGLLWVAKVVTTKSEAKLKELRLCDSCRKALIKSVNKVFIKQK